MSRLLRLLFGRSLVLPPLLLVSMLILSSCGPLSFLPSGPNVAANVQAGAENRQALLSNELGDSAGRDIVTKEIEADNVGTVTINNITMPWWVILAGFWFFFMWSYLLWKLPSPEQIWKKDK